MSELIHEAINACAGEPGLDWWDYLFGGAIIVWAWALVFLGRRER